MFLFLKIAWRNVLRHKRRSILVILTVTLGLAFSIFIRAMMNGIWDRMIERAINLNTGYIQLHKKGYQDNETLEYTFEDDPSLEKAIMKTPSVIGITKRIESAGLISPVEDTSGAVIVGIQPELEGKFTSLKDKIIEGQWIGPGYSKEVLVGCDLAKNINIKIGDEVALLTQTYYGSLGAELYKIKGIFKSGTRMLDRSTIFITFEDAQLLMDAKGRTSRILIWLDDIGSINTVKKTMEDSIISKKNYELSTWDKILPEVMQLIAFDRIAADILLFMLLVVVLTAVFNTIFTSVTERLREFGIMFALGTKPMQTALLIFTETVIITGIGIIIGSIIGGAFAAYHTTTPVTFFGHAEGWQAMGFVPVFYCKIGAANLLLLSSLVMIISLLGTLYPINIVLKSKPIEMLRFI